MKNAGLTIGVVAIGLGLASIGFNLDGHQANATPAAFNAGPVEPTIVWYNAMREDSFHLFLFRTWSDGRIEGWVIDRGYGNGWDDCTNTGVCLGPWVVLASPNEGLNARADINFDEQVDAADLGLLVAAWGDAPRNDYPPSNCTLWLIP